jgi:hypothetical protein
MNIDAIRLNPVFPYGCKRRYQREVGVSRIHTGGVSERRYFWHHHEIVRAAEIAFSQVLQGMMLVEVR